MNGGIGHSRWLARTVKLDSTGRSKVCIYRSFAVLADQTLPRVPLGLNFGQELVHTDFAHSESLDFGAWVEGLVLLEESNCIRKMLGCGLVMAWLIVHLLHLASCHDPLPRSSRVPSRQEAGMVKRAHNVACRVEDILEAHNPDRPALFGVRPDAHVLRVERLPAPVDYAAGNRATVRLARRPMQVEDALHKRLGGLVVKTELLSSTLSNLLFEK